MFPFFPRLAYPSPPPAYRYACLPDNPPCATPTFPSRDKCCILFDGLTYAPFSLSYFILLQPPCFPRRVCALQMIFPPSSPIFFLGGNFPPFPFWQSGFCACPPLPITFFSPLSIRPPTPPCPLHFPPYSAFPHMAFHDRTTPWLYNSCGPVAFDSALPSSKEYFDFQCPCSPVETPSP